jgi:hypothetical protein
MNEIDRLRAMAREAVIEYEAETRAGGEPAYPQWADDILNVCQRAEAGPLIASFDHIRVVRMPATAKMRDFAA